MGIQQGGVGSIPGASSDFNQLMAISRAKNEAAKNGTPYTGPDPNLIRNRYSGGADDYQNYDYGTPAQGYLQSDEFQNRPGQNAGWNYDQTDGWSRKPQAVGALTPGQNQPP